MGKTAASILLLLLLTAVTSWSLLLPEFFYIHDFLHAARIAEMGRGLMDGQFPVRWSESFGYGYGMPLFLFYAPLPYVVGAIAWLGGVSIVSSVKLLFFLSTLFSGLGMFLLTRKFMGIMPAMVATAAFTLAPYRGVNLVVRGAISESWAIAAYPWILLGIVMIMRREKWGVVMLISALATLFLSHNISVLLFVPLTLLFITAWFVWCWRSQKTKYLLRAAMHFFGSYVLAAGLAAFYLVPAFLEKQFTVVEDAILDGYFLYTLHFVSLRQFVTENWGYGGSNYGPEDGISFFLGYGQLLAVVLLLAVGGYYAWTRSKKIASLATLFHISSEKQLFLYVSVGLLLISLLMAHYKSALVWQYVPLLEYLQFPWRWLGGASLFLALSLGLGLELLRSRVMRILSVLILAVLLGTSWRYFIPESQLPDAGELYFSDQRRIAEELSPILPDYLSSSFSVPEVDIGQYQSLALSNPERTPVGSEVSRGVGSREYVVELDQAELVLLPIAHFPGWTMMRDGQPQEILVNDDGLISTSLPAGEHSLRVEFQQTPIRLVSDTISSISLLIFIAVIAEQQYRILRWFKIR